jgi:para-aminobenzoate synthetase component 1
VQAIEIAANELVLALLSLDSNRQLSLLDSCGVKGARLLIAGIDPFEVIEVRNGKARISRRDTDKIQIVETDAFAALDERLEKYRALPVVDDDFSRGACIVTISYEMAHRIERLRSIPSIRKENKEPDAVFSFYDTLVVHDYSSSRTLISSSQGGAAIREVENALRTSRSDLLADVPTPSTVVSNLTRDLYLAAIERIKEHISAGDIYQANFTQQFSCSLPQELSPENIFVRLRREHPAPFSAFIRRREDVVISISPERFLRVDSAQSSTSHCSADQRDATAR